MGRCAVPRARTSTAGSAPRTRWWSAWALAAVHPESGGTDVDGRRQLGPTWGAVAGIAFVVGKTASCAAMALTVGAYAAPSAVRPVAVAAVVVLAAANLRGIASTARLARILLAGVLAVLALMVAAAALLAGGPGSGRARRPGAGRGARRPPVGGLLFFAFAGCARIATLGGEVREPARTIPRAVRLALAGALVVHLSVSVSALLAVGAPALAGSSAPLSTVVASTAWAATEPMVRAGGAVAALGVLLSLLAGVSRTAWAMSREGDLPRRSRRRRSSAGCRGRSRSSACSAASCWRSPCRCRRSSPAPRCWGWALLHAVRHRR